MKKTEKPDLQAARRKAMPAVSLGINFAVGVALLTYIGFKIDEKRGSGNAWTLCGIFLGLMYGAYETWKLVRTMSKNDEDNDT